MNSNQAPSLPTVDVPKVPSYEEAQKIALETTSPVQGIMAMSGEKLHEQTISTILAAEDIDLQTKLDLIRQENDDHDRRLENNTNRVIRVQNAQTQNAVCIMNANILAKIRTFLLSFGITFLNSPEGRNLIIKGFKKLTA